MGTVLSVFKDFGPPITVFALCLLLIHRSHKQDIKALESQHNTAIKVIQEAYDKALDQVTKFIKEYEK